METSLVYLLYYEEYDESRVVGVYRTREGAERRILDDVMRGARVQLPAIVEKELL